MDKNKALKYYTMAANQGDAEAQNSLGVMYITGEGAECDSGEAQRFWELAAAQGHQGAQTNLARLKSENARR